MRYKHIKTGAIIDSPSKIIGKAWELIDGVQQESVEEVAVQETADEYVEEEINLEEMTNKELEALAEKEGVKLTTEDKKNKTNLIAAIVKAFE